MSKMVTQDISQMARAVVSLREMILQGELVPGQRIAEARVADRLFMSRTPIRQALPLLAREGLVEIAAGRGYVVRAVRPEDVGDALDVRGVVEGLAARRVAERGISGTCLVNLRECLAEGDAVLSARPQEIDEAAYARMNAQFHGLILSEAEIPLLSELYERIEKIPYSAPVNLAFGETGTARVRDLLAYAHRQHWTIVAALERRESARVESLMREHAHLVKESLALPAQATARTRRRAGATHTTVRAVSDSLQGSAGRVTSDDVVPSTHRTH